MLQQLRRGAGALLRVGERKMARLATVPSCAFCGCYRAWLVHTPAQPDFDADDFLPTSAFLRKRNGYCDNCGLFQDYSVLSDHDIDTIRRLGKDELTRDPDYKTYPPSAAVVRAQYLKNFHRRLVAWHIYLLGWRGTIETALFLRPMLGHGVRYLQVSHNARVSGLDISPICNRYNLENCPGFDLLAGDINGQLQGPFTSMQFDAVFVWHVLSHQLDVMRTLRQLHAMVKPGGFVLFSDEVMRKPANPFHRVHPSEANLVMLLSSVFDRVDRIDDCEDDFAPATSPYSSKGDVPDFVAWRLT